MSPTLEIYKALADESRLRLVHIFNHGSFNVQEITSILDLGQSTISHHLRILLGAGVTRRKKQGTWTYYQLANGDGSASVHQIVQNCLALPKDGDDLELREQVASDKSRALAVLLKRREETQQFFETIGGKWREVRPTVEDEPKVIAQLIGKIPKDSALLELGCGSGMLLEQILPRPGVTIAVDYSQAMLEEARKNLGDRAHQVDFRLGYLEHLPLADESVQQAVAYMVFHHLSEPKAALREVFRVLQPGGQLHIVDLTAHEREAMREQFGDLWLGFEPKDFSQWVKDAGFVEPKLSFTGNSREVFFITTRK